MGLDLVEPKKHVARALHQVTAYEDQPVIAQVLGACQACASLTGLAVSRFHAFVSPNLDFAISAYTRLRQQRLHIAASRQVEKSMFTGQMLQTANYTRPVQATRRLFGSSLYELDILPDQH